MFAKSELSAAPGLPTGVFGRIFASTAASYKFFWLLALLKLAPHASRFSVGDVLIEMVAAAWAPASLYRLSFGPHDRLQDLVRDLQADMRLAPSSSEGQVKRALSAWPNASLRLEPLARYVPSRFLAPWHADDMPASLRDDLRSREIIARSQARRGTDREGPYVVSGVGSAADITLNHAWRTWLLENLVVVRGFAEQELAKFLQARNPHVPGIVDKLGRPGVRNLVAARRWFGRLRAVGGLTDLYTGESLGDAYAVDHFLPRAFVAHDLLWNLAPTAKLTNQAKADRLPDATFLSRLADLHYQVLQAAPATHPDLEDYAAALSADVATLLGATSEAFARRYSALFAPLMQIAENQGFRAGWRPSV